MKKNELEQTINEAFENNSNQNKNPPLLKDDIGLDDDIPF